MNSNRFLGNDLLALDYDQCKTVIIPAPLDQTTSYGKGTAKGPDQILKASAFVELYDEDLDCEPCESGIFTHAGLSNAMTQKKFLSDLENIISKVFLDRKFPVTIGGEHSLSISPVKAIKKSFKNKFTVIQLDAHADLRNEYEGSKQSHACVMRRIIEETLPTIQIGIRSLSSEEADFISNNNLNLIYAREINENIAWIDKLTSSLTTDVYITLDIDVFDPAVIFHTGTPEPGGLDWYQVLGIFRILKEKKIHVLGLDVVEFSPKENHEAQSFTCAKLIYKMIGLFAD